MDTPVLTVRLGIIDHYSIVFIIAYRNVLIYSPVVEDKLWPLNSKFHS